MLPLHTYIYTSFCIWSILQSFHMSVTSTSIQLQLGNEAPKVSTINMVMAGGQDNMQHWNGKGGSIRGMMDSTELCKAIRRNETWGWRVVSVFHVFFFILVSVHILTDMDVLYCIHIRKLSENLPAYVRNDAAGWSMRKTRPVSVVCNIEHWWMFTVLHTTSLCYVYNIYWI